MNEYGDCHYIVLEAVALGQSAKITAKHIHTLIHSINNGNGQ